jgi:dimethylglycine dehydrogenase
LRVNYEGELGWELYHPIEQQLSLYDQLMEAGRTKGLKLAGMRAIESCRLDKSYRAMYRDLNVEHTAWESGLDRFIKLDNREFVGREALERQREAGLEIEMVALKVETVDADAYMNEAVYSDGKLVGRVTSGAHSHTQKQTFSMAYLDVEYSAVGTELEIPILGERRRATVIEDSPYDPHNKRPRM